MWTAYNDPYSKAVFAAFKKALDPVIAVNMQGWMLHHIEMGRNDTFETGEERVEIRLVIKPIGQARFVEDPEQLEQPQLRLPNRR